MQKVKKKVTISMCFGKMVEDGRFVDVTEPVYRAVTPERATKLLRKRFGNDSVNITHIEADTSTYEMPLETFMKYAVTYDTNDNGEEMENDNE